MITANGGGNGANPHGQNSGYQKMYGTGFAALANGNGTSAAYIYPEALSIWRELANTPLIGNGVGGGGGYSSNDIWCESQPGAVFLIIRGIVFVSL